MKGLEDHGLTMYWMKGWMTDNVLDEWGETLTMYWMKGWRIMDSSCTG